MTLNSFARTCRTAVAVLVVAAVESTAAAAQASHHIMYRVVGPKGATVYLLGSVHLLTPDAGKLPAVVDSAFAHAKTIALETNLDTAMMSANDLLGRAQYENGATLRSSLAPATVARTDTMLREYGLGLDAVNGFKPWFVSVMVAQLAMQRANFQADYGVDIQLNARAHAAGKRVIGLEPVSYQFALFDSMSVADQEAMLLAIEPPDSAVVELTAIKNAWVAGDTAALGAVMDAKTPGSDRLNDELVVQRSEHWLPEIEAMLGGTDDVLVVVGAGHLLGKQGLLALLAAHGYRVIQM
ncbi:MAG TPA: TraB/GumN family protein [Gemmatimonadaceae bacterium]|jgi:hypothetical protein